MVRTAAKVLGFVFVLIGILGFFPALAPNGELLGIFHINALHNIIHLASGLVALAAGYSSYKASRTYFQVFGIVYGLVALLGFVYGDNDIVGLVANNVADTFLHVAITAAALYFGFGAARDEAIA
ncbi:MAG: DUF4383 domain-containing protein [Candidatus Saccharimonadales bacterium]